MNTAREAGRRSRSSHHNAYELAWDIALALAFAAAAFVLFLSVWPGPGADTSHAQVFVGTLNVAEAQANTISIRVTANASMKNIIHGSETTVQVPKGGTVAQLSNRLVDRYPILANPYAMVSINGGMLPLSYPLTDGQTVELMPPHVQLTAGADGGLTPIR
jgi:molybdopterin converting factor small subunit